ncbi:MAG: KamA family radical SAM protein [Lentisphaeria bacterium]
MKTSLAAAPTLPASEDPSSACRAEEPPLSATDEPPSCPPTTAAPILSFSLQGETPRDQFFRARHSPAWNDWRWQMRNRITSFARLVELFPETRAHVGLEDAAAKFPMAITPYYASLIREFSGSDPVFQMAVPQIQELYDPPYLKNDPLAEDEHMPVPGLCHRYGDRALLLATTTCSMYCRHCTRKRGVGHRDCCISDEHLRQAVAYLQGHPEIHDVIISGGDPFTMATAALERVVAAVRSVASVDIIRIGTRTPVVMPMRINAELVKMLRKYAPVWVNTHFNHPHEQTPAAFEACGRLVDAGIPVNNQAVLLRGVNDQPQIQETLVRTLLRMRVRPYYLFQCDLVRGVEHFRTPISRGIEIMEYLRGRVSGLAIPNYVVDAPNGGGKIPVMPNYVISVSPTHTVLRNFEGMLVNYPEPRGAVYTPAVPAPDSPVNGVYDLATGRHSHLLPQQSARLTRQAHMHQEQAAAEEPTGT